MKNMTVEQFAMQTASNEPVPGRKYFRPCWCPAAALTEMVADSPSQEKICEVEEEMRRQLLPCLRICEHLLDDIKRDSEPLTCTCRP